MTITLTQKKLQLLGACGVCCAVAALIIGLLLYRSHNSNTAVSAADREVATITAKVKRLVSIPTSETPSLLTVSDANKVKAQPFFTKAENGDKVLIFSNANLAILYRPSVDKIITMATINGNTADATQTAATTSASNATNVPTIISVAILNGTTRAGLAKNAQKTITDGMPATRIVNIDNAARSDYKKSVVVAASGFQTQAQTIAQLLNASVEPLPSGETNPNVNVLVILGQDFQPH